MVRYHCAKQRPTVMGAKKRMCSSKQQRYDDAVHWTRSRRFGIQRSCYGEQRDSDKESDVRSSLSNEYLSGQPKAEASLSGRRIIVAGVTSSAVALGGNLGNITTNLLCTTKSSSVTSYLRDRVKVDVIYPVCGNTRENEKTTFKRHYDAASGFEFMYPSSWIADFTIERKKQELLQRQVGLDLPALDSRNVQKIMQAVPKAGNIDKRRLVSLLPVIAYGPADSTGELNVSVVIQDLPSDQIIRRLSEIGEPEEVAARLLESIFSLRADDRKFHLLNAYKREIMTGAKSVDTEYYTMEYIVTTPKWKRHNVATICIYQSQLFSLNCQSPEAIWQSIQSQLLYAAESFSVGN